MALSQDLRNYLARRWIHDEWGREPTGQEQSTVAQTIVDKGIDLAFASVLDSPNAAAFRKKRGW